MKTRPRTLIALAALAVALGACNPFTPPEWPHDPVDRCDRPVVTVGPADLGRWGCGS